MRFRTLYFILLETFVKRFFLSVFHYFVSIFNVCQYTLSQHNVFNQDILIFNKIPLSWVMLKISDMEEHNNNYIDKQLSISLILEGFFRKKSVFFGGGGIIFVPRMGFDFFQTLGRFFMSSKGGGVDFVSCA